MLLYKLMQQQLMNQNNYLPMNEENNNQPTPPNFSEAEMKMPENAPTQPETPKKNSAPILIGLTILLLIILGGLYTWFTILNTQPTAPVPTLVERPTDEENNEPESTTAEAQADTLETVSSSDELSAIEADLESTNLDSLDSELSSIDAELEAGAEAQ